MAKPASVSSLILRAVFSFFAVILNSAVPAPAQMHGIPASRPSMRSTPGPYKTGVPDPVVSSRAHGNVPSCRRRSVDPPTFGHPGPDHRHDRHGDRIIPVVYTYYPGVPAPVYPSDESSQNMQPPVSSADQSGDQQGTLQSEIHQLRQELADLKESQMLDSPAEATPEKPIADPPAPEPETTETQDSSLEPSAFLVLRDARTVELHNYLVVKGSIWNLVEDRMERIPLDDLDISATRELNESRGLSKNTVAILNAVDNLNHSAR